MSERAQIQAAVKDAFDGAGDLVIAATLTRETEAYDTATATTNTTPTTSGCRVLFDEGQKAVRDYLVGVEIGPTDCVLYLADATFAPRKGDQLTFANGLPKLEIVYADDLLRAGAFHTVVGR